MRVYEVSGDHDFAWVNYHGGVATLERLRGLWFKCQGDTTSPVELEFVGESYQPDGWLATDCPHMSGYGLLLSARAVSALRRHLEGAGVLLPTVSEVGDYRLFLCQRRIDALDEAGSTLRRFRDGGIMGIDRYALRPEAIGDATLFRLVGYNGGPLCTDAFVADVERHGLTGFAFREVWSSEAGGVALDNTIPWEREPGAFARAARAKREALRARLAALRSEPGG